MSGCCQEERGKGGRRHAQLCGVAAREEGPGEREHRLGRERNVERLRVEAPAVEHVEQRLVPRFERHDGRGGEEERRVGQEVGL